MRNIRKTFQLGLSLLALIAIAYFLCPLFFHIWTTLQNYNDRISRQSDYTKITTPLSRGVKEDICSKFNIDKSDSRCLPNSVVYGPDFFSDIKFFLAHVDEQQANVITIREKLGRYLV